MLHLLFLTTIIQVQGSSHIYSYLDGFKISNPVVIRDGSALRTIGGHKVDITEVPYQVGLYLVIKRLPYTFGTCGGSLLSHQHILTAAHCCQRHKKLVEKIDVVLGSNFIGTRGTRRSVEGIFVHPKFDEDKLVHDLAILQIPLVVYNNRIRPISLPTNKGHNYIGKQAMMSGYGKVSDDDRINDKRLRAVNLEIIPNSECKMILDDPDDLIQITDYNICSAATTKGSCDGDSGGPLVIMENGIRVLIGVTSYGADMCNSELPSVFVRLDSYLDWIEKLTTKTDFRVRKRIKHTLRNKFVY